MKKTIAFLLAAILLLSLVGCAGGQKTGDGDQTTEAPTVAPTEPAPLTIADDTQVMQLSFKAPDAYETVERFAETDTNGTLTEKDLSYTLSDGGNVTYAWMKGQEIATVTDPSTLETKEFGGQAFKLVEKSGYYIAFAERNGDLYAVSCEPADGQDGSAMLDSTLAQVGFDSATETSVDDIDLYGARYTVDEALPLAGISIRVTASPDGTVTKKDVAWKYGASVDELDYTLMIRVFKNAALESVLKEDKEYEQTTVGGLEYTVLKTDDDAPYEYYTQHGDDVFEIRNNGKTGWVTTRSDASVAAFEAFLNSVSF